MRAVGATLELFYVDGHPDGLLTAEMFNWTGHVLMAPRTQLADVLARREAGYSGVYILFGERDGQALAYIGESDELGARIRNHDARKDWWTSAAYITASGNRLNKAHVRYLEARMVQIATEVGSCALDNGTVPQRTSLSDADEAKMEAFLESLLMVLPALKIDLFVKRVRPKLPTLTTVPNVLQADLPRFTLTGKKHHLHARAVLSEGEFVVEAGSTARLQWEGHETGRSRYSSIHAELLRTGVLKPEGETCVFTENYAFRSPSAAACVVHGRSANGAVEWRTEAGQTYKEWEAASLGSPPG